MKKQIGILLGTAMLGIVACGPSAEQQAADTKRVADSTAQAMTDSMNKANEAAAAAQKAMSDSLAMVNQMDSMKKAMDDSIANIKAAADKKVKAATTKPKTTTPKTEPKQTDPTKVKPGQGRG